MNEFRQALFGKVLAAAVLAMVVAAGGQAIPRAVFAFDEGQTVYTVRKLIAEWGVLE